MLQVSPALLPEQVLSSYRRMTEPLKYSAILESTQIMLFACNATVKSRPSNL